MHIPAPRQRKRSRLTRQSPDRKAAHRDEIIIRDQRAWIAMNVSFYRIRPPGLLNSRSEPMIKGRVDKKASTATGYAWVVWEKPGNGQTALNWVPPCRKALERDNDYIQNPLLRKKAMPR